MKAAPEFEVRGVTKNFGGLRAVDGVSFTMETPNVTGIIGPNGSGKSTLVNLVSGYLKPDSGTVRLHGSEITGLSPHSIARRGLMRTFQGVRLFRPFTVFDNVMAASFLHDFKSEGGRDQYQVVDEYLKLLGIEEERDTRVSDLSFGQQKLVELAKVLIASPSLVVLDEPSQGVDITFHERLTKTIKEMNERKIGFVIIEHNIQLITDVCDYVIVLNFGQKIEEGTPEHVQKSSRVIEAYLGE